MIYRGSYRKAMVSGTIAAGLTAASLVYAFKFGPTNPAEARIKRIAISLGDTTGFTAGFVNIEARISRAYTTLEGTGGTAGVFTNHDAKIVTAAPTSFGAAAYMTTTAAISGGAHTDDTDPFAHLVLSAAATAGQPVSGPIEIFRALPGEQLLVLAKNEGFSLKATVPATGTWQLGVAVDWDEWA